jgi:hypothetical protein
MFISSNAILNDCFGLKVKYTISHETSAKLHVVIHWLILGKNIVTC